MKDDICKLAKKAIEARAQAADCLAVEYADLQSKSMEAHRAFLARVQPDDIVALEARVAELEAALRPFAEEAQRYEPDDGDSNMPAWSSNEFSIGHFRRAAAAMEGK